MRQPMQNWSQFRHVGRQTQHLGEVMDRLGTDALSAARLANGDAFATAQRNCLQCRHERQCRYWLDASIVLEGPPVFCPNAGFFTACRALAGATTVADSAGL